MNKNEYSVECEECGSYNISLIKCEKCWQKLFKDAVENLKNPYPLDIFPKIELNDYQTIELNNFFLHNAYFGFAFDRLSAELMRRARENVKLELLKAFDNSQQNKFEELHTAVGGRTG